MKTELMPAAATICVELLRQMTARAPGGIANVEQIASAFEDAYRGVLAGIEKIKAEDTLRARQRRE